jgi:hypothetical protein
MLNWVSKEFLIAICGALAIAVISLWPSPPYQTSQGPQIEAKQKANGGHESQDDREQPKTPVTSGRNDNASHGGEEASEYWTLLGRRLKITDTLLVLFTFTLWWSTRGLVNGAEETARRELRAYVFVAQTKIIDPDGPDPLGEIMINNFGKTPAYDVSFAVIFRGFNPNDGRIFEPPKFDKDSSRFVLGPGQPGVKNMPLKTLLNADMMVTLRSRSPHVLYAWGILQYRDAFDKIQTTEFRASIGGPSGWPASNLMVVDPEGNKAT